MTGPRSLPAESLDLPELDKSAEDGEVDVGGFDLTLADEQDEVPEHEALHDAFQVDIQALTDSGSDEATTELDIGVADLLGALPDSPEARDDDELPATANDERDEYLDTPLGDDDPSTQGELGEDGLEELPELVRDEGEDGPDAEGTLLTAAPEGALPQGPAYSAEWLLLGTACTALWGNADLVLGAAEHLMRFGRERRSDNLPEGVRVSALGLRENGNVVMATTRGVLEQSSGGGWQPWPAVDVARGGGQADIQELATVAGERALWARLSNGSLLRRRNGEWERHETGGAVRSLSGQAAELSLLVLARRPTLQLSSDAGNSFREVLLPEPAASIALGNSPCLVARGPLVGLSEPERGLCVSSDGGETFRWVTGAVNVTAIALGEHAGRPALFAALHREARDVSELILVDPASGHASSIAELSAAPDEDAEENGRTQALVFHDGTLWAAGGYGLARLKGQ